MRSLAEATLPSRPPPVEHLGEHTASHPLARGEGCPLATETYRCSSAHREVRLPRTLCSCSVRSLPDSR